MRKLTAHMYTTLDGRAEFPKYPGSSTPSNKPDPAFIEMWIDRYDAVDTLLFGRRAYDDQAVYWPSSARKPSDPKFVRDFSQWKDGVQKIVFSHYLTKTAWQNSRIVKGDLTQIVARLRRERGKDMILEGGPLLTQQFLQRGLIDDLRILMFPVILGSGKNWFGAMLNQQTLKLRSAKGLKGGELLLHYEMIR
ncbi:MAG: dihydrofolate reductase family protein [Thermoplasmata archaeon]|nr:dihydrofolate reductase family protein [Thermoplasmata archaeon]